GCVYVDIYSWLFFFFSSRRRHTRWPRDWSSDVCSSDLTTLRWEAVFAIRGIDPNAGSFQIGPCSFYLMDDGQFALWGRRFSSGRSEERRVGKECRAGRASREDRSKGKE